MHILSYPNFNIIVSLYSILFHFVVIEFTVSLDVMYTVIVSYKLQLVVVLFLLSAFCFDDHNHI